MQVCCGILWPRFTAPSRPDPTWATLVTCWDVEQGLRPPGSSGGAIFVWQASGAGAVRMDSSLGLSRVGEAVSRSPRQTCLPWWFSSFCLSVVFVFKKTCQKAGMFATNRKSETELPVEGGQDAIPSLPFFPPFRIVGAHAHAPGVSQATGSGTHCSQPCGTRGLNHAAVGLPV